MLPTINTCIWHKQFQRVTARSIITNNSKETIQTHQNQNWPTLAEDCRQFCKTCESCQFKARVTFHDPVPIKPIPRCGLCVWSLVYRLCRSVFRLSTIIHLLLWTVFSRFPVLPIEIYNSACSVWLFVELVAIHGVQFSYFVRFGNKLY